MKEERYFRHKNIIKIGCFLLSILFLTGFYDPGVNYINKEEISIELGEEVCQEKLNFLSNDLISGNFILEDNIPRDDSGHTNKIGVFNYYIVYRDEERMYSRITKNVATISVIDTTNPILKVKDTSLKFNYGTNIKPSDIVSCYDLSTCSLSFKNKVNNKKVGKQEVTIVALDEANNSSEITVNITIKEKPYYSSSLVSINNYNKNLNTSYSSSEKTELRNELVAYAKQFVGNPYVWGGNSLTNGIDCSGFTKAIFNHFGYQLPRVAPSQGYIGKSVGRSQLLPGDLVVFHKGGVGYHVGIYIGGNKIIHAGTPQTGIEISNLWEADKFYRRIIY